MTAEKKDLYVIGFPKSGNTWLTRLLADVTDSNISVCSTTDLVNSSENSQNKVGDYLIHKIHVAKELEKVLSNKKIYIVRDPRDVFVSGFFHNYRSFQSQGMKLSFVKKIFFAIEISNLNKSWNYSLSARRNDLKQKLQGNKVFSVGGWSEHVSFWEKQKDIVIVRYEDLLEDTYNEMKRILVALGIVFCQKRLMQTVNDQCFENKKKYFLEKGDVKNAQFLRNGEKESWRRFLSLKQIRSIEHRHKMMMINYHYIKE